MIFFSITSNFEFSIAVDRESVFHPNAVAGQINRQVLQTLDSIGVLCRLKVVGRATHLTCRQGLIGIDRLADEFFEK